MLKTADRKKIDGKLSRYPHPLKQMETETLFNRVHGRVADGKLNVHYALAIGECMAAEFKCGILDTL